MGFRKGLILELASIAGLILGIWGSLKFSNILAVYLAESLEASASLISLVAFILTFILIVVLVYLAAKLLDKTLKMAAMGMLLRVSGALFGFLKYAIILCVVLYVFEGINKRWEFVDQNTYKDAVSYKAFNSINGPMNQWLDELDLDADLEKVKENTLLP